MTQGHLLFALVMSAYIVVGVLLEERDLAAALGASYARYRERVPMLIPFLKRARKDQRTV
jgi:protein-S-isoprenylcysteine O-methyltransferase Ste14